MKQLSLAVLVLMVLGGCSGTSVQRTVGPDGKSVAVSSLTAPYAPKDALTRTVAVLKRLQLQGETEGGFLGFGGNDWAIKSDYYSASVKAKTVSGEMVEVSATWIGESKSDMKVRSSLNDAQHRNLVDQIKAGLK